MTGVTECNEKIKENKNGQRILQNQHENKRDNKSEKVTGVIECNEKEGEKTKRIRMWIKKGKEKIEPER